VCPALQQLTEPIEMPLECGIPPMGKSSFGVIHGHAQAHPSSIYRYSTLFIREQSSGAM